MKTLERNELLKTVGFSDNFLIALEKFEKFVPNTDFNLTFDEIQKDFNVIDTSGQLIINCQNDNYNSNVIIRQSKI